MDKELKNIQEIDEYISGDLEGEARNEFEKKLREDPNLQEELNTVKRVIQGIRGSEFKKMLMDIHQKLIDEKSES